jgi:hypothetical protein
VRSDHGPGTLPVHRTSGTFAAKMARAASAFAADTSWLSLKRVPSTSVATTRTGPAVWPGGICLLLVERQHCGQEEAGTCRRTPPALQLCNARGARGLPRGRRIWLGQRFSAQTQAKILHCTSIVLLLLQTNLGRETFSQTRIPVWHKL